MAQDSLENALPLTELAEDERLFRASVVEFAEQRVRPHAREMDEHAKLPRTLIDELFQLGVMGIEVPESYGGAGARFFHSVLAVEALSESDPSVGVLVDVQNTLVVNALLRWGSDDLKRRYLPRVAEGAAIAAFALTESEAGSDVAAMSTAARAEGTTLQPPDLTAAQRQAAAPLLEAIAAGTNRAVLLHGVTGSGKTEVYLAAIDAALALGRQAICLVPEIALTPQMIRRFAARFPGRLAVSHSGLTDAERAVEWRRARLGEIDVVVGSRSAIFAPLPRLGVVVVDEEDASAYKQDRVPRYHAVDVALELGRRAGVPERDAGGTERFEGHRPTHVHEESRCPTPSSPPTGSR